MVKPYVLVNNVNQYLYHFPNWTLSFSPDLPSLPMRLLVMFFLLVAAVLASPREQTTRSTRLHKGLGQGEEESKDTVAMRGAAVEDLDETDGQTF